MKITNYKIIVNCDSQELARLVGIQIWHGWQPLGGLVMSTGQEVGHGTDLYFAQAMVEYAKKRAPRVAKAKTK